MKNFLFAFILCSLACTGSQKRAWADAEDLIDPPTIVNPTPADIEAFTSGEDNLLFKMKILVGNIDEDKARQNKYPEGERLAHQDEWKDLPWLEESLERLFNKIKVQHQKLKDMKMKLGYPIEAYVRIPKIIGGHKEGCDCNRIEDAYRKKLNENLDQLERDEEVLEKAPQFDPLEAKILMRIIRLERENEALMAGVKKREADEMMDGHCQCFGQQAIERAPKPDAPAASLGTATVAPPLGGTATPAPAGAPPADQMGSDKAGSDNGNNKEKK